MTKIQASGLQTLRWIGSIDGHLRLIDQTRLPHELTHVDCHAIDTVWEAIRSLRVRGAPAIGMAAAYAVVLGLRLPFANDGRPKRRVEEVADYLATSRPTAVNLFWALDRMRAIARAAPENISRSELATALLAEARAIHEHDREVCRAIGKHGAKLLGDEQGVLTHCNAGGLATAEMGTALAVLFTAHQQGKRLHVFVDETRPLFQGARLTTWELMQHGVKSTLICDNMAAQVMREGRVQAVITGADRVAANGDSANKIGTYGVAVLAKAHGIPFYIAAPISTFDFTLADGSGIPIEQRDAREITHPLGAMAAPEGVSVYNPAFDVTPASLIKGIICERGVIDPVTTENIARVVQGKNG